MAPAGTSERDGWRDVVAGLGGAAVMVAAAATTFLRPARRRWGLDAATPLAFMAARTSAWRPCVQATCALR